MNKLIFTDLIFNLIAAGFCCYILKFKYNIKIFILGIIIWSFIILNTILLHYNKYVYSCGGFLLGILVVLIYINKIFSSLNISNEFVTIFWCLIVVSSFTIIGLIITKKYIINNLNNDAPLGPIGKQGSIGTQGKAFLIENIGDRCYHDLIIYIEELLVKIKESNNIEYDENDYQLNNYFLKNKLKNICYSKQFLEKIKEQMDLQTLKDLGETINYSVYDTEYKTILNSLKTTVTYWIYEILENKNEKGSNQTCFSEPSCNTNEKCTQDPGITKCVLRNEYANNKTGMKFLSSNFENPTFFQSNNNPFCKIENGAYDGSLAITGPVKVPAYNFGTKNLEKYVNLKQKIMN